MAGSKIEEIRNVALVGHSGSGKTMLAEAMLVQGGELNRLGKVVDGTTASDFDVDEKEAHKSFYSAVLHTTWQGQEVNIIDTPGSADFVGQVYGALSVVELALITVNAASGIEMGTRKAWDLAKQQGCACIFVITRMDAEHVQFDDVVASLQTTFGPECTPLMVPIGSGSTFAGTINLLHPADVPEALHEMVEERRGMLIESVISGDDTLLDRYLEGETIPSEELEQVFTQVLVDGTIVPILCCAAEQDQGIAPLLDTLVAYAPSPAYARKQVATEAGNEDHDLDLAGPLKAQVFKIMSDEFVGKISFMRLFAGTLKAGDAVQVANVSKSVKIPKLFRIQGKEQQEVSEVGPGTIVATAKVDELHVGDTLMATKEPRAFVRPLYPVPMVSRAVAAKSRGDEAKISEGLRRLAEEDPTFRVEVNAQTKELVISGLGEQHINLMLHRLRRRDVDVVTKPPKIAYLETISANADIRYRHKKQTGGAGQFAECAIRIEPTARGEGYQFVDKIFGGVISQPFRQSVDRGIQDKMAEGILAGYPVVDLKVELYDGKEHPVDSKDIAFQIAGREAIKEAVNQATPVLLEPIVKMEVVLPSKFMGDVTGDVSSRRGRVIGMDSLGGLQVVRTEVPSAEIQQYSSFLKSVTGGEGTYSVEFLRYEVVPAHLTQAVIAGAQGEKAEG
ncbi:Elongation factor G [Candidatus Entotheonellaceae bacterium PAL068K]